MRSSRGVAQRDRIAGQPRRRGSVMQHTGCATRTPQTLVLTCCIAVSFGLGDPGEVTVSLCV